MKARRPNHYVRVCCRTVGGMPLEQSDMGMLTLAREHATRRQTRSVHRAGMASLEVVMATAAMLPGGGGMLFLGIKMCALLYQCIGALVSWPFL